MAEENQKIEGQQNQNQSQPASDELEKIKAEFNKCLTEKEEYLNGWKRAKADFINYKKEEARRLEEITKLGIESLVEELLVVLDSFDVGLSMLADNKEAQKGLFLIRSQMEEILKKYGLRRIAVKIGEPFNPQFHEAVTEEENSQYPPGSVIQEIASGYQLHERVIRPVKVKTAKIKGQTM